MICVCSFAISTRNHAFHSLAHLSYSSSLCQLTLAQAVLLEGENATSVLINAMRAGSSVANFAKYGGVTASAVSAAAAAALKSVPAYAVLGSTLGTPSFDKVTKMLK